MRPVWPVSYHAPMTPPTPTTPGTPPGRTPATTPTKPLGPYTPAVRAGDWIIVSGQLGVVDGTLVSGGVAAQTAQAVTNLEAQLATMGATLADVAKTLCFLTDMDTFATFNEAYIAGFGTSRPARSTIGVAALPLGGAVEIEAWAYQPLGSGATPKQ